MKTNRARIADAPVEDETDLPNPNDAESARRDRGLPARDGTTKRRGVATPIQATVNERLHHQG